MSSTPRRRLFGVLLTMSATIATLGAGVGVAAAETVHATVSGPLNIRSGPSTAYPAVGKLPNNAAVSITCQTSGRWINGDVRGTAQWDKLADGRYVSHAYVRTTAKIPACGATATPTPDPAPPSANPGGVIARVSTGTAGSLNIRTAPTAGASRVGAIANRSEITIVCQVTGQWINGHVRSTAQWNQLNTGNYISHGYVDTPSPIPACSGLATPAPVKGPTGRMTNAQFVAASVAPAQQGQREFGVPASVTIAQAILESGWGRSSLTANDRNYFGIKCFNGAYGPIAVGCHTYRTWECTPNCYTTSASFRVYANITDSFRDHGRFLVVNSRYRNAFNYKHDSYQFLYQIWKAGYATDPNYVPKVWKLINDYKLTQYDLR